jgi:hypothetical protein
MKKILFLGFAIICVLFLSCQKAEPPEGKKEVQVQKEEVKKPQTVEQRSEDQVKQQPEKVISQQPKGEKKEEVFILRSNPLTEEERIEFKTFKGVPIPPDTKQEALYDLKLLLRGTPETIPYYQRPEFGEGKDRLDKYADDYCTAVKGAASLQCKECYDLIIKTIQEKATPPYIHPSIRGCAAEALGWYGELKDGKWYGDKAAVPVLKEIINDQDPEVRLQAAGSLLSLGEGDIALPILNELAKEGIHQSTFALNKLFAPEEKNEDGKKRIVISHTKLWDERGREILIKALNYSSDEVKAFAAVSLAEMGIEKKLVEATSIRILERLKDKKKKDYGTEQEWHSDGRAGYHAISALEKIKSTVSISLLKYLIENNDDELLRPRAKEAIKNIHKK